MNVWRDVLQFLRARLSEPSTWRGVVALVTAAGVSLEPTQVAAIVSAGMAVMGLVGAFLPDRPRL